VIELTDDEIEIGTVIKLFLDSLTGRKYPTKACTDMATVREVLRLCKKYDCALLQFSLRSFADAMIFQQTGSITDVLTIMVDYEEYDQCAAVMQKYSDLVWKRRDSQEIEKNLDLNWETHDKSLHGESLADPTAWSRRAVRKLPADAYWALCRAHRAGADAAERGAIFVKLMSKSGECDCSWLEFQ
jgi:hypothetical protein